MWVAALFALVASLALAGPALAAPSTTVTFTFDDGRPSQMAAEQELVNRNMKATYFIISAQIDQPGVMSLSDLDKLKADGMEIAAHTVTHRDLTSLSSTEAKQEICASRDWLMARGFDVYGLAYPYDATNATVKSLVAACGMNYARSGGQLLCDANHACAETLPPADPYALRTPLAFESTTTLADMKAMVTDAQAQGGGWVPFEIHDICDGPGDPLLPPFASCTAPGFVTRAVYTQFLDWLQGEVTAGRVQVKTVHEVTGGALQPAVPVSSAPIRSGNMIINPSFEQAATGNKPSSCWDNVSNGPDTPPTISTTSDAHSGSKALSIQVPAGYDSWAYNLVTPSLDLIDCAPTAVPRHHYTFTGWYKGDGPIKVVAYWRNPDNQWQRLDWGTDGTASFPAAASWTQASFTFVAPDGATAVSAGFYVDTASTGHTYTIDDTSLTDGDASTPTTFGLTVASAGTGSGSVTSSPAGIACGTTCQAFYDAGTTIILTETPAAGSTFTGWSGACTGSSVACIVSMSAAKSATATFALLPVQLSVSKVGTGNGTVTSSPAGIDCGATCHVSVANGTGVTLTEAPAAGSTFAGWSGACGGAATTCTVSMDAAKSVTAQFTLLPVHLTVAKTGTGSGSVTSSPAGIACGAVCEADMANGASVTLTASPAAGSSFAGWSSPCAGTSTCTVTMSAATSVTATFTLLPAHLTLAKAGTGAGTISSSPAGIACGATCEADFTNGAAVALTAVPAAGSSFTTWSGACTGAATTCILSMTAAKSVTAQFTLLPVHLTVVKAGTGTGSVSSNPSGIACGATCEADFTNGATVTLTAAPAASSTFAGWSGDCSGISTCTVSLASAKSVTATFTLLPGQLAVSKAGTGTGTVTSSPSGIDCGVACQAAFANGTSVTLTAVAASDSTFTGWSGACTGTSATCTLSMTTGRAATATFTAKVSLAVVKAGTGSGAVTSSPAAIDCGATCVAAIGNGTSVTLTAVASPNSTFTGWSGACTGTSATCTFAMTSDRSATATFTAKAVVTVVKAGTGSGTVTSNAAAAIDCGATCTGSVANGTSVTLTAVAAAGSSFTGWSGACTGTSATCTFSMTSDRTATAMFTSNAALTVAAAGTGDGTITSNGAAAINCGIACSASLVNGTAVTLLAVAAPGSSFTGWTGDCTGTAPTCTLVMSANRSATAIFTVRAALQVVTTGTGTLTSDAAAAIDCGTVCADSLVNGTTVVLTAAPAQGFTFTGWSGACTGTDVTCTLDMTGDRLATATFTAIPVVPTPDPTPDPVTTPDADTGSPGPATVPVVAPVEIAPVVTPVAPVVVPKAKARPAIKARPKVSGRAKAGLKLTCGRGTWNGSPTRYAFTWRLDGKTVVGHGATYKVRKADRGRSVRCEVTAVNAGGATIVASNAVKVAR